LVLGIGIYWFLDGIVGGQVGIPSPFKNLLGIWNCNCGILVILIGNFSTERLDSLELERKRK